MAEMKEVLKLESSRFEKRNINIEGAVIELLDPRTLTLSETKRIKLISQALEKYGKDELDEDGIKKLTKDLDDCLKMAAPNLTDELLTKLTEQEKIQIVDVFFSVQRTLAPKDAVMSQA